MRKKYTKYINKFTAKERDTVNQYEKVLNVTSEEPVKIHQNDTSYTPLRKAETVPMLVQCTKDQNAHLTFRNLPFRRTSQHAKGTALQYGL